MDDPLSRRRVIEAGGVGAALSLSGCSAFSSQSSQSGDGGGDEDSTATVTVFAAADQEELDAYQEELQSQLDAGEIDSQEAQRLAREKQVALLSAAVESFEARASEEPGLTVAERASDAGVLLVEGTAAAIVETLTLDSVHGLLAPEAYEEYRGDGAGTERSS